MRNYILLLVILLITSCQKFVDVGQPTTQLVAATIFRTDQAATAAQLAIYARMEGDGLVYQQILYPGLSADEYVNYATTASSVDLATNNLTPENPIIQTIWANYYKYIYQANDILKGIAASHELSNGTKQQLEGEARFIRAYCHFYLVNLFGDIPIVTTTDYRVNAVLPRSAVSEVYDFIEQDLFAAAQQLSLNYIDANGNTTPEKVRPNRFTAKALLARLHLYTGQWALAEQEASEVIAAGYLLATNLDHVFLKNSTEAIWQLQNVVPNYNTYAGAQLILTTTPTIAALDTNFVKSFSAIDKRKTSWIKSITVTGKTYFFSNKYKVRQSATLTEYTMLFRLSEIYLIRSEARLKLGNFPGAEQDIHMVRTRAGLPNLSGLSPSAFLDSIMKERRLELFSETGDRWLDLKRTGTVNTIMPFFKGTSWATTDALYPIPQQEISRNNNLTQNPGY